MFLPQCFSYSTDWLRPLHLLYNGLDLLSLSVSLLSPSSTQLYRGCYISEHYSDKMSVEVTRWRRYRYTVNFYHPACIWRDSPPPLEVFSFSSLLFSIASGYRTWLQKCPLLFLGTWLHAIQWLCPSVIATALFQRLKNSDKKMQIHKERRMKVFRKRQNHFFHASSLIGKLTRQKEMRKRENDWCKI